MLALSLSASLCVCWYLSLFSHIRQTYVSVFRDDAVVRSRYVAMATGEVTLVFLFVAS